MWLTGPQRNGMVLGSFTPYLYSGNLLSYPFGLKVLLTLTLGSRDHFHPESWIIVNIPYSAVLRQTLHCDRLPLGVSASNPLSSRGPGILVQYPGPHDPLSIEGTRIVHWHIPRSNSFLPT